MSLPCARGDPLSLILCFHACRVASVRAWLLGMGAWGVCAVPPLGPGVGLATVGWRVLQSLTGHATRELWHCPRGPLSSQ